MSDKFHQALSSIIGILKTAPMSVTIEGIQRLANIYKFETFIESVQDDIQRLSIAGKILVIDIDYTVTNVVTHGISTMTFFDTKDIKLILANNYNSFNYHHNGSNLFIEALSQTENLNKFNSVLEKLVIFDQFSDERVNLFEYYMGLYAKLSQESTFDSIELNYRDDFIFLIDELISVELVNDERLSLDRVINDVGIKIGFTNGDVVIPKNCLLQSNALFEESKTPISGVVKFETNDNNSEMFINDDRNLSLSILKFFSKELVVVNSVRLNQLSIPLLIKINNFNRLITMLNTLIKNNFRTVNKYEKFNSIDFNMQLFKEFENGHDSSKQDNYVTVSITEDYLKFKSNLEQLNDQLEFNDVQFLPKLKDLSSSFDKSLR